MARHSVACLRVVVIFALALAVLPAAAAQAQVLRVGALSLVPPPGWQRADDAEETAHGAFLLHAVDHPGIQVVLPRVAPVLKVGEADYVDNLRRQWQVRHGIQVRIEEAEVAGMRWLMLRRRAQDGQTTLFQLSRVHGGRAHSVLVFAPSGTRALPPPARALLERVRFVDTADVWRPVRRVWARPSGDALQALLMPQTDGEGAHAMVTGYGLTHRDDTVRWFAEGFDWVQTDGRDTRRNWHQGGQLRVIAPEVLDAATPWHLRLDVDAGSAPVSAGLRLWLTCAPARQLERALDRLEQGTIDPLRRLLAADSARCADRPPPGGSRYVRVDAGQGVEQSLPLPLPEPLAGRGRAHHLLVEVFVQADTEQPGTALLDAVRAVHVYRVDTD